MSLILLMSITVTFKLILGTHTKLEVYMIEEPDNPQIYNQLANKELLKKAVIVIMLDFTNPWNFMAELNRWIKFIYELQKRAEFTISEL